jgi:dCMP deaminase
MRERVRWEDTWMDIARTIARNRSPDPRLQVCAIIVTDDNASMLALGYNGGIVGGSNEPASVEPGKSEFLHAELNACIKCPFHHPKKKIMYVTASPCRDCARIIVNAGISKVVYDEAYRDMGGVEILRSAGIEVIKLSDIT